jgi:hypothetical protein
MRPCHCPGSSDIALQLDSIAEMVAVHLVGGATHEEGEGEVRDTKRVRWSALARVKEEGSHSVDERLTAINSVMYDQLGYKGAGEAYYDLDNSFIDRVLERRTGIPITLCVIYEAVARRLGVHLHPVSLTSNLKYFALCQLSVLHPNRSTFLNILSFKLLLEKMGQDHILIAV